MDVDRTELISKFIDVCNYINDPKKSVTDDTLVEKLFDLVKTTADQNKDFVEDLQNEAGFCQLLRSACQDGHSEIGTNFMLRILGKFSSMDAQVASTLWEHGVTSDVFMRCLESSHWLTASVRCAWFQSVQSFLDQPTGVTLVVSKDMISVGFLHVCDSSMFVAGAAQQFICKLLQTVHSSLNSDQGMNRLWTMTLKRAVENTLQLLKSHKSEERQAGLQLIRRICLSAPVVLEEFVANEKLIEILCQHLTAGGADCVDSTVYAIIDVMETGCNISTSDEQLLNGTTRGLLRKGNLTDGLSLAAHLALRSKDRAIQEDMKQLLLSPVIMNLNGLTVDCTDEYQRLNSEKAEDEIILAIRDSAKLKNKIILLKCLTLCLDVAKKGGATGIESFLLPLLKMTIGECQLKHTALSRTVIGNRRIQKCLLELISLCIYAVEKKSAVTLQEIFQCLLLLSVDPNLDAPMFSKILENLNHLLRCCTELPDMLVVIFSKVPAESDITENLGNIVKRKLQHVQWEVRDSCLEFLKNLLKDLKGHISLHTWFCEHQLHLGVWQCLDDSDSYVRASAISTLAYLSQDEDLWQQLQNDTKSDCQKIISRIIGILQTDTEAFARRSAVNFLASFYKQTFISTENKDLLKKALCCAIHDLDWQVKIHTLSFWEEVIQTKLEQFRKQTLMQTVPYASCLNAKSNDSPFGQQVAHQSAIQDLCECGAAYVLIHGVKDYDNAVKEKSCCTLVSLKRELKQWPDWKATDHSVLVSTSLYDKSEVNHTNSNKDSTESENGQNITYDVKTNEKVMNVKPQVFSNFLRTDFDEILHETEMYSNDYLSNPMSLFNDIMTVSPDQDSEENMVDCY